MSWNAPTTSTGSRPGPRTSRGPTRHPPGRPAPPGRPRPGGAGPSLINGILGEIAASAGRTGTFLGERYRRLARRRGKRKAVTAVARSVLVIIFHLLADPEARSTTSDLYDNRISRDRKIASHVRQLRALGLTVTLTPAEDAA